MYTYPCVESVYVCEYACEYFAAAYGARLRLARCPLVSCSSVSPSSLFLSVLPSLLPTSPARLLSALSRLSLLPFSHFHLLVCVRPSFLLSVCLFRRRRERGCGCADDLRPCAWTSEGLLPLSSEDALVFPWLPQRQHECWESRTERFVLPPRSTAQHHRQNNQVNDQRIPDSSSP